MFRYNPAANYQPNGVRYLQVLSGKDLYKQTIVVRDRNTFPARFPNIFVDYPLRQMHVGDNCGCTGIKPFKVMANSVKFCSVLCIKCLWG